jgi:hypothetical protein
MPEMFTPCNAEGTETPSCRCKGVEGLSETMEPEIRGGRIARTVATLSAPRALVGVGIGLALVVAACGGTSNSTTSAKDAVAVSPGGLRALAQSMRQPIYWVGPSSHVTYERTIPGDGRILIRYLQAGAKLGTRTPYLSVATYVLADAYAATQRAANRPGAIRIKVATSAIAFTTKVRPLNAWITYPGSRYQIEVFDPRPGRARELVASGRVARVPGSPREVRPVEVSPKSLAKVATTARGPIYWAGALPNQTYELTKTSQGGFLVRYLPPGAVIGVPTANLTVGTYPVRSALAAVKRLAAAKGASSISLPHGGLAVLDPHFPRSVYLAYPDANYEIEVFDPSLAHARQLVTSGQIVAAS